MIAVAEAERLVLEKLFTPQEKLVALADSLGHTLAQPVIADRDLPPYNRVAMDGIAISYAGGALQENYPIEHVQAAGDAAYSLQNPLACVEVMTGAVLPIGTNTVVPYEDLQIENGRALIKGTVRQRQHIHHRGADVAAQTTLLPVGTVVGPSEVAVLAAVGIAQASVFHLPPVALIATGNELVAVAETPRPHQIRMSNTHALDAALATLKIESRLYHLTDDAETIRTALMSILKEHPVVILSGGVSKGKLDFIPTALADLGVEQVFHQIRQKPGKPFWFGRSSLNTVFALPGNPVSTFLCFHRYIRPWLQRSLKQTLRHETAVLASDVNFTPPLTYFLQVKLSHVDGITAAQPLPGGGSGDFVTLVQADGFLELPADRSNFQKDEWYPLIRFR
jgi:molybdopterin molybdotransferase